MSATRFPGITPGLDVPAAAPVPGIVPMAEWRAETEPVHRPAPVAASACAAAARKN